MSRLHEDAVSFVLRENMRGVSNLSAAWPMIHFNCQLCNRAISVEDKLAGKRGRCPGCLEKIRVPELAKSKSREESLSAQVKTENTSIVQVESPSAPPSRSTNDGFDVAAFLSKSDKNRSRSPASRRPDRNNSRVDLWIYLGVGGCVFVVATTVGATLWATGSFSSVKTPQPSDLQLLNPDQSYRKPTDQVVAIEPKAPQSSPSRIRSTDAAPVSNVIKSSHEHSKADPSLKAFKEKVGHYLDETRIGAKLLTRAPSLDDATEQARHIQYLYARLPEVPPGVDPIGKVAQRLKNIHESFAFAKLLVETALEFERSDSIDEAKKFYEVELPKAAMTLNDDATEIESLLDLKSPD
jgi:hypothetical protein